MIEAGIIALVNSDPTVTEILSQSPDGPEGGFGFDELSKNLPLPSWAFRFFGGQRMITLLGARGWQSRRLEIHSLGSDGDQCILLANAIDLVLNGFTGPLPDPDTVMVDYCFSVNSPIDFFDSIARSYRRVHEYRIAFNA